MTLTDQRIERLKDVVRKRQIDWTVILENVHDPHNLGAVLRTCDSVGIKEIFVVYTEPELQLRGIKPGHKSSSGARKWMDIHYFRDLGSCFQAVRSGYNNIFGTVISDDSRSLYDLDLSHSCALLFGNEHSGISKEARSYIDVNFNIPQVGFVQSLNISVACAVSLYEGFRQRSSEDKFNLPFGAEEHHHALLERYESIHKKAKSPPANRSL